MWLAARTRMIQVEDSLLGHEDAVVGFGVAAGEMMEIDFGEGVVHGAEK